MSGESEEGIKAGAAAAAAHGRLPSAAGTGAWALLPTHPVKVAADPRQGGDPEEEAAEPGDGAGQVGDVVLVLPQGEVGPEAAAGARLRGRCRARWMLAAPARGLAKARQRLAARRAPATAAHLLQRDSPAGAAADAPVEVVGERMKGDDPERAVAQPPVVPHERVAGQAGEPGHQRGVGHGQEEQHEVGRAQLAQGERQPAGWASGGAREGGGAEAVGGCGRKASGVRRSASRRPPCRSQKCQVACQACARTATHLPRRSAGSSAKARLRCRVQPSQ